MTTPIDNHSDFMQYVWDLEQQIKQLLAALEAAQKAIKTLDVDALGFGGTDRYQWPLRDELLKDIDLAGIIARDWDD